MPTSHFLISALTIIMIDLLLAGDNALVIAMAVRQLPPRERRIGSICGAGLAVLLRVGLTFVAAQLLNVQFVRLVGGLFILWIAFQVLRDAHEPPAEVVAASSLRRAIWYVLVADVTMSVDNILAIAGASRGHFGLILFGLAVSIPFVIFSSNLLVNLMNRYPVVIYIGSGILGKVGGDMIMEDPWMVATFHRPTWMRYIVDAILVVIILLAGWLVSRRSSRAKA
jgi:YjbE family integral membrane protein